LKSPFPPMKRPTRLALLASVAVCALMLAMQSRQIRSLESRAATLRNSPPNSATEIPSSETPAPRNRTAHTSPNTPPASQEKLDRVAEIISRHLAEIGDISSSPVAFLRLLPALLPLVESLEIDELIAVADRLGNHPALSFPNDDKSSAQLLLYLLAAELDPLKILSREDLDLASDEGGFQLSIFNNLAHKDPDAAIRWLDAQSMHPGQKSAFHRGIALGFLVHDPRRGLDFILENPGIIPTSGMGNIIAGLRIPDAARNDLIEALPDPRYADFRPALSNLVLESSLATVPIPDLREQTAALQIADEQVTTFLRNHSSKLIQRDPAATAAWMKDALPADEFPSLLSTAIRHWTTRDFNAAATYLGTMERSPARDLSIKEFASVVAPMEPPSAAKWALEIDNPSLRQSALLQVGKSWLHLDPAAAREWMNSQGIPEPTATTPDTESP